MSSTTDSAPWLPLGSALVIDWKYLGRPAPARGATAWVRHLDGEPVLLRAWGEETTSFFDFVFLTDERLIGTVVVVCSRAEAGRLRVKTTVEVEGHLAYSDTCEFKENGRTMLLTAQNRALESKQGVLPPAGPPRIDAQSAEVFEIAPDGVLLTRSADWITEILRMVRDLVQGREPAQPRGRTELAPAQLRPSPLRETLDAPRKSALGGAEPKREGAAPSAAPTSQPSEVPTPPAAASKPAAKAKEVPVKLVCTTNAGETFEIAADQTFVGRSKQCAIVLKSQRVSRKHACVTREADGFYINDVGAANGIWQGSEKIDRERIETGAEYIIGDVVLKFTFG